MVDETRKLSLRVVMKNSRHKGRTATGRLITLLSGVLLPAAVLVCLWYPEYDYYTVNQDIITTELVSQSRSQPADSVLSDLCNITYFFDIEPERLKSEASRISGGEFSLFADSTQKFDLPFNPYDLESGTASKRLRMAAGYPATVLTSAYLEYGNDSLLGLAANMIQSFFEYEQSTLLPKGFIRNDHATAGRVALLSRFWLAYRTHDSYEPSFGMMILKQAARTAAFLANEDHYTVGTNHGVMQNLALLHLSLAFPGLPSSRENIDLAISRFDDQLPFYISGDGVVLEHSAGYQVAGVQLLGMILRCMSIAQRPIPSSWMTKYNKSLEVYASLRRPDGSLPLIGDTSPKQKKMYPQRTEQNNAQSYQSLIDHPAWPRPQTESLLGTAGYVLWWDNLEYWPVAESLTQTVVGFSYYPGQAHKLADEMALYLWKSGSSFWSAAGYFPYGEGGRKYSRSWNSSNAPHFAHENIPDAITGSYGSNRITTVKGYGTNYADAIIDMLRTIDNQYTVRRQVVKLAGNTWIVIDAYAGHPEGKGRTVWTTSSGIKVTKATSNSAFILEDSVGLKMTVWFYGSDEKDVKTFRGSQQPFLGWQAYSFVPVPATAFVSARSPGDSWSAAIFSFDPAISKPPQIITNGPTDNWTVTMSSDERVTVERKGDSLNITRGNSKSSIALKSIPGAFESSAKIKQAFREAQKRYPRFRSAISSRTKISIVLILIIMLQEIVLLVVRRWKEQIHQPLRYLSTVAWVTGAVWLFFFYRIG